MKKNSNKLKIMKLFCWYPANKPDISLLFLLHILKSILKSKHKHLWILLTNKTLFSICFEIHFVSMFLSLFQIVLSFSFSFFVSFLFFRFIFLSLVFLYISYLTVIQMCSRAQALFNYLFSLKNYPPCRDLNPGPYRYQANMLTN